MKSSVMTSLRLFVFRFSRPLSATHYGSARGRDSRAACQRQPIIHINHFRNWRAKLWSVQTELPVRVISVVLTAGQLFPVYPDERTSSDRPGMSGWCQKETLSLAR
jgi:hypothetical protein